MASASLPLACEHPYLKPEQPLDCPRDDGLSDVLLRAPLSGCRIVEAQCRKVAPVPEPIHVWRRLTRAARIMADGWVHDQYGDVRMIEDPVAEIELVEIPDTNTPYLGDRLQRTLPDPDPSRLQNGMKGRKMLPEPTSLLFDREGRNGHQSPKNVFRGVARTVLAAAATEPIGGTRPFCAR